MRALGRDLAGAAAGRRPRRPHRRPRRGQDHAHPGHRRRPRRPRRDHEPDVRDRPGAPAARSRPQPGPRGRLPADLARRGRRPRPRRLARGLRHRRRVGRGAGGGPRVEPPRGRGCAARAATTSAAPTSPRRRRRAAQRRDHGLRPRWRGVRLPLRLAVRRSSGSLPRAAPRPRHLGCGGDRRAARRVPRRRPPRHARPRRHAELLAPSDRGGARRGGAPSGTTHRRRGRRRPGAVHRAARAAWSRRGCSGWRSACRCTGCARSTRSPCRSPARRGAGVAPGERFAVATDARRREVYWARVRGGRHRPLAVPSRAAVAGPGGHRAGADCRQACASFGRGATLYPERGEPPPGPLDVDAARRRRARRLGSGATRRGRAAAARAAVPAPPGRRAAGGAQAGAAMTAAEARPAGSLLRVPRLPRAPGVLTACGSGRCAGGTSRRSRPLDAALFGPTAWTAGRSGRSSRPAPPAGTSSPRSPTGQPSPATPGCCAAGTEADVQTIGVAPAAQGRGVGTVLLRALVDEAARRGATSLLLEVRADNAAAIRLYTREGFERIAVRRALLPARRRRRAGDAAAAAAAAGRRARASPTSPGRRAGMPDEPLVLGIETSCDETGIGLVRGQRLLADAVASSVDEHARFGGRRPRGRQPRPPRGDGPHDRAGLRARRGCGWTTSTRSR